MSRATASTPGRAYTDKVRRSRCRPFGLQHHRRRPRLSQMRQRRMPQLMQSPPTRILPELRRRQSGTTTGPDQQTRTHPPGRGGAGLPPGQEQRPGVTPGQVTTQEASGGRRPHNHVRAAPLGTDPGPPPGPVQVPHIQSQDLRRSGGGLVQHPPQQLLPKRHPPAAPQALEIPNGIARVLSTRRRRGSTGGQQILG